VEEALPEYDAFSDLDKKLQQFDQGLLDDGDLSPAKDTHERAIPNFYVIEANPWQCFYYLDQRKHVAYAMLFSHCLPTRTNLDDALKAALMDAVNHWEQ